jgi:hypothetical protein
LELIGFFLFDNTKLEVCEDISYLGFTLNYNGSFIKAKNKLVQQTQRALYSVYRKVRNLCIPVDLQLKLFDSIVLPILTYSCEVWGFENCVEIEKVHLRLCKKILKVRQTTSNYMVYGELGRYPLNIHSNVRMIGFLLKLKSSNKLSSNVYQLLFTLKESKNFHFK